MANSVVVQSVAYFFAIILLSILRSIYIRSERASYVCRPMGIRNGAISYSLVGDTIQADLQCHEFSTMGLLSVMLAERPSLEACRAVVERAERFCIPDQTIQWVSAYADTERYLSTHKIQLDHAAAIRESTWDPVNDIRRVVDGYIRLHIHPGYSVLEKTESFFERLISGQFDPPVFDELWFSERPMQVTPFSADHLGRLHSGPLNPSVLDELWISHRPMQVTPFQPDHLVMVYSANNDSIRIIATVPGSENRATVDNCAICLERLDEKQQTALSCAHSFHFGCIEAWLKIRPNCPLCIEPVNGLLPLFQFVVTDY
jgi:hypothetical protein